MVYNEMYKDYDEDIDMDTCVPAPKEEPTAEPEYMYTHVAETDATKGRNPEVKCQNDGDKSNTLENEYFYVTDPETSDNKNQAANDQSRCKDKIKQNSDIDGPIQQVGEEIKLDKAGDVVKDCEVMKDVDQMPHHYENELDANVEYTQIDKTPKSAMAGETIMVNNDVYND